MNRCQLFYEFHCTHAKDNQKSMLARNSMFFMHHTNLQIRKLTLTSLVMPLHSVLKFRQCIVSKDNISMNKEDNFIKFAG